MPQKDQKVESKELQDSRDTLKIMANDTFKRDITAYLRSRYPLFFITTNEEKRLLQFLDHYSKVEGYQCYIWDCFRGLISMRDGEVTNVTSGNIKDPNYILEHIRDDAISYVSNPDAIKQKRDDNVRGIIYILLDYFRFMGTDENVNPDVERRLKVLTGLDSIVTTVITGPCYKASSVVENLIPVLDFPYPNREEIKQALWQVVNGVAGKIEGIEKKTKEMEEVLINSTSGLTLLEAQIAYSKSLVTYKGWDIKTILEEKKQIISKSGILEYYDNFVTTKDVGGLKNLIRWIRDRKSCFSEEAEKYGLQKPKGLLLLGTPGCGKSLTCKAISNTWDMPLLRMDFGKLFGSFVGQSEARAREALQMAEELAPCVLLIDEIEKGLSGARSSGRTDGGTTSRVLSTFLTWMQEKIKPVFVVATANDHESIPPEFLRAGRFDEIFFVDLPNINEREEIFEVHLKKKKYDIKNFDLKRLSKESEKYSGAEIEKAVNNAMLQSFIDKKRKMKTDDILDVMKNIKPLAVMREEDFASLREWVEDGRCLKANAPDIQKEDIGLKSQKDLDI